MNGHAHRTGSPRIVTLDQIEAAHRRAARAERLRDAGSLLIAALSLLALAAIFAIVIGGLGGVL